MKEDVPSLHHAAALQGHEGVVWNVAWSPGRYSLASCGSDKTIRIWNRQNSDYTNWVCSSVIDSGHQRTIRCLAWSPNGSMLASGGFDGIVCIWKESDDHEYECIATLEGHENEIKSISWSPCSEQPLLATCSRDKSVWIWELVAEEDGEFECVSVLQGHSQDVKFVKWSPSQRMLISSSYDDTIKVWAEDEDDWFCVQTLRGHTSTVWAVAFLDPNGIEFVSVSDDRSVIVWRNSQHGQLESQAQWDKIAVISGYHDRPIYSVSSCVELPNALITTGGGDDNICVFVVSNQNDDDEVGRQRLTHIFTLSNAHAGEVNCLNWTSGLVTPLLASAGDDGVVNIWFLKIS